MTRLLGEVDDTICAALACGDEWHTESDGWCLVARRGRRDAEFINRPSFRRGEVLRDALLLKTTPIDLGRFVAFLGDPDFGSEPGDCAECDGTGRECRANCNCSVCECPECGGDGSTEEIPAPRFVVIDGETFNGNLVAVALAHAGLTGGKADAACDRETRRIVVRTRDTVVVVMGTSADAGTSAPTYSLNGVAS